MVNLTAGSSVIGQTVDCIYRIAAGVETTIDSATIEIADSNSGDLCDSRTISASSCMQGVCTVSSITPLPCSERVGNGDIDISISAINRLGRGPPSTTTIGRINKYVNITFEPTNKIIICTFVEKQEYWGTISCNIAYVPCQKQPFQDTLNSPNIVTIDLPLNTSEPCYVVNASNGTFTVLIEGVTLSSVMTNPGDKSTGERQSTGFLGVSVTSLIIAIIVIVIAAVIVTVMILRRSKECKARLLSDRSEHQPKYTHISFDLEDKPKELMNVLQKLETLQINFDKINIGPYTSSDRCAVRKINMKCGKDLTEKKKQDIKDLQIGIIDTLKVFCKAEIQKDKQLQDT